MKVGEFLQKSINDKFHDAKIFCIKKNKNKNSLDLYLSLINKIDKVIIFVNPVFWELPPLNNKMSYLNFQRLMEKRFLTFYWKNIQS